MSETESTGNGLQLHELIEKVLNTDAVLYREEQSRRKKDSQPKSLYPSSIGYGNNCLGRPLRDVIDWKNKPAFSTELLRIFESGNQAEESIIKNLIDSFVRAEVGIEDIDFQVPAYNEKMRLSGRCDAICAINGVRYVLEIKSTSTYSFEKIEDSEKMRNDDSFHRVYWWQAQCYTELYGVGTVLFLFRSKESNTFKVVPVHRNEEAIEMLYAWAEKIWEAVEHFNATGEEPGCEFFNPSKYVCNQCPHREYCLHGNTLSPVKIVLNDELIEKIKKRDLLYPQSKEFDKLDGEIKGDLKDYAFQNFDNPTLSKGANFFVGTEFRAVVKECTRKNPPSPGKPDTKYLKVDWDRA